MRDIEYTQRLRSALVDGISEHQRKLRHRRRVVLVPAIALLVLTMGIGAAVGTGLWRIWPAPEDVPASVEPHAVGPEREIVRGTHEILTPEGRRSVTWRVTAFQSDSGLCIHVEDQRSKSGGCGFAVPPGAIAIDIAGARDAAGTFVMGPVIREAIRVDVVLDSGETRTVRPVGSDLGFSVNFYVLRLLDDVAVRRVVAYDANGDRLGAATP